MLTATNTLVATKIKPILVSSTTAANGGLERQNLLKEAENLFAQAKLMAAKGELQEAGLLILKGLSCERRAKTKGPQVLGLIKKRE